jgi:hypothetical protein
MFKRAKVIAIPRPGKDVSDPVHYRYRPILFLSVMYKLLERLIFQCIQPLIEAATPVHQTGVLQHCTEQVMALATHIETGFQHQLKTEVVFVELSAAYALCGGMDLC